MWTAALQSACRVCIHLETLCRRQLAGCESWVPATCMWPGSHSRLVWILLSSAQELIHLGGYTMAIASGGRVRLQTRCPGQVKTLDRVFLDFHTPHLRSSVSPLIFNPRMWQKDPSAWLNTDHSYTFIRSCPLCFTWWWFWHVLVILYWLQQLSSN